MLKNGMRRIHPGEILREDYQTELGLTVAALAIKLDLPESLTHAILTERQAVSADIALRLARSLGTTAAFWLNLQTAYDRNRPTPTDHPSPTPTLL